MLTLVGVPLSRSLSAGCLHAPALGVRALVDQVAQYTSAHTLCARFSCSIQILPRRSHPGFKSALSSIQHMIAFQGVLLRRTLVRHGKRTTVRPPPLLLLTLVLSLLFAPLMALGAVAVTVALACTISCARVYLRRNRGSATGWRCSTVARRSCSSTPKASASRRTHALMYAHFCHYILRALLTVSILILLVHC